MGRIILSNEIKKGFEILFCQDLISQIINGTVRTEEDAKEVAIKYLNKGYKCYDPTLAVSNLLPKTIKEIIETKTYNHPYFSECKYMLYKDIWGRVWSKTVGIIKENSDLKFNLINDEYSIDTLGGGLWRSLDCKEFICEYRTTIEEQKERINPQTFIG